MLAPFFLPPFSSLCFSLCLSLSVCLSSFLLSLLWNWIISNSPFSFPQSTLITHLNVMRKNVLSQLLRSSWFLCSYWTSLKAHTRARTCSGTSLFAYSPFVVSFLFVFRNPSALSSPAHVPAPAGKSLNIPSPQRLLPLCISDSIHFCTMYLSMKLTIVQNYYLILSYSTFIPEKDGCFLELKCLL